MDEAMDLGLIKDQGDTEEQEPGGGDGGEETTEETEAPEETEGGQESEGGEEPGGDEEPGSARALPTELRRAVRELVAQNPDFAKKFPKLERQLTAAWFKASQADKFGGFQKIRSAMDALEQHGGAEGIAEMAEEVEASRLLEDGFKAGDPELIDTWMKSYPDGFKNLVGPAISKLEAADLAAHDRAIAEPMLRTLSRTGVLNVMGELKAAIAGERYEDIQRQFGALEDFFANLRDFAARAKTPSTDPLKGDREKLNAERTEFQSEREAAFRGDVQNAVNNQVMMFTNRLLRQALAGKKLRVETANRVRKQISLDLQDALKAHARNQATGYAARYKAAQTSGDGDRLTQLISGAARHKLPTIVKKVLRDFNLSTGSLAGSRRAAGGGGPRHAGTASVTGRPKTGDVDFTRTDKARYLASLGGHGEAWLKNGKQARW